MNSWDETLRQNGFKVIKKQNEIRNFLEVEFEIKGNPDLIGIPQYIENERIFLEDILNGKIEETLESLIQKKKEIIERSKDEISNLTAYLEDIKKQRTYIEEMGLNKTDRLLKLYKRWKKQYFNDKIENIVFVEIAERGKKTTTLVDQLDRYSMVVRLIIVFPFNVSNIEFHGNQDFEINPFY